MCTDDDAVGAWKLLLEQRGQWREDMRPILAAHRAELPYPEDIADHHGFELRPDRPFPAGEFPGATAWVWEDEDVPDDQLLERTLRDGWVPLRHYGCGEYDILIVSGPDAGRVWTLTDLGVMLIGEAERGQQQLGWVNAIEVPAPPRERPARTSTAIEKVRRAVMAQRPPDTRLAFMTLTADTVRVNAQRGGIVRNLDITPGARRKTYDVKLHTFPIAQHRRIQTVERTGVPTDALGALLT